VGEGGKEWGEGGEKTNKVERAKQGRNVNKNRMGVKPAKRERERKSERALTNTFVINIGVCVFVERSIGNKEKKYIKII
jgi:hypothetical protein